MPLEEHDRRESTLEHRLRPEGLGDGQQAVMVERQLAVEPLHLRSRLRDQRAREVELALEVLPLALGTLPRPHGAQRGLEPIGELVHHRIVGGVVGRRRPDRSLGRLSAWS
jgi:hypothetical protein